MEVVLIDNNDNENGDYYHQDHSNNYNNDIMYIKKKDYRQQNYLQQPLQYITHENITHLYAFLWGRP